MNVYDKTEIDIENKLVVTSGRREKGRCTETVTWKFTITCEIDGQLEFAV